MRSPPAPVGGVSEVVSLGDDLGFVRRVCDGQGEGWDGAHSIFLSLSMLPMVLLCMDSEIEVEV